MTELCQLFTNKTWNGSQSIFQFTSTNLGSLDPAYRPLQHMLNFTSYIYATMHLVQFDNSLLQAHAVLAVNGATVRCKCDITASGSMILTACEMLLCRCWTLV